MRIGYARVSTLDQNLDMQLDALKKERCVLIFQEKASGVSKARPELERMLQQLRPGDEVLVWKLDRLGRDLAHLIDLVNLLGDKQVTFYSINDKIDTSTATGKLVFHIFCSLAEFERAQIKERTIAGLAAARIKGKIGGKPKGLSDAAKNTARIAESLYRDGFTIKEIASQLYISRPTTYNYLRSRGIEFGQSL